MRTLPLSLCAILLAGSAPTLTMAQTTTTTTTTSAAATTAPTTTADTSTQAQQAAIQTQITQGIMNGTLTQDQIGALQAQQDRLTSARAAAAGGGANGPSRTSTGPDPFTYNTLGPDAYQSQKYQNPQYNVPAYPTTNSTSLNTTQQYNQGSATGPASVTPQVGTYYGNNGVNTGVSGGVATATPNGNGVYVYQTGIGKGR